MEIQIKSTGKQFVLSSEANAEKINDWIKSELGLSFSLSVAKGSDGDVVTNKMNRAEQGELREKISRLNKNPDPDNTQIKIKPKGRRLELLSIAERDGLSHGASWFCTEYHVDAKGAKPEWEGEMICYVYN